MDKEIVLIAHNIRSCHNIGSLFRTADGLGVAKLYLSGYTPYPKSKDDPRLPHIALKLDNQIHKTALGGENVVPWEHRTDIENIIDELKNREFRIVALEQTSESISLEKYKSPQKVAIILGREVEGIESEVLKLADEMVSIPMLGSKESFNVVQAAAMTIYKLRFC